MNLDVLANKHRPARVLLVEDNHGDVILTQRAFKETRIANTLSIAISGEEALAMLHKEGSWQDFSTPDLILLDLNLPELSGREVLKLIKEAPDLKHIPVVILSSSRADQDVVKSYNLHANGYIVKPVSLENFNELVQKLEQFWFAVVIMPDLGDAVMVA